MIALLLLFLGFLGAIELFRRLPVVAAFRAIPAAALRARQVARRRGRNDYHRERALQIVTCRMLRASLRAGALLALVAAPIAAVLLLDRIVPIGVVAGLTDWRVRGALLVLTLGYAFLRTWLARRIRAR